MELSHKIKTIDPRGLAGCQNISLAITKNKAAGCLWAIGTRMFYARFEDFEWNYQNESAVIYEAEREIELDANCLSLDHLNNPRILFFGNNALWYFEEQYQDWSAPTIIHRGPVNTFATEVQSYYPYFTYFAYIRATNSAQSTLVLTDQAGSFAEEVYLESANNSLLQIKLLGTNLYIMWVETDDPAEESSSSSSFSLTTTSMGISSSSSSFSSSSDLESTSMSSSSGSNSSSSSTENLTESRIKYLRYDIITRTFDIYPPQDIDFTGTFGEINSLDFGSVR